MGNEQLFEKQLNDLYYTLEKNDIAGSVELFRQMGEARNTMAVEPLVILLGEFPDEQVRRCAAAALGAIGPASALEPLIKALNDESHLVQEDAALALGAIGDDRAIDALEVVSPENPLVKKAAAHALSQIRNKNRKDGLFKSSLNPGDRHKADKPPQTVADGGQEAPPGPSKQRVKKVAAASDAGPSDVPKQDAGPAASGKKDGSGADRKNPLVAAIASFFIPGLGQLYNGEKATRALMFMFGFMIGTVLLIIPGIVIWVYGINNAYRTAKKINEGTLPFQKNESIKLAIFAVFGLGVQTMFTLMVVVLWAAVLAAFLFPVNYHYAAPGYENAPTAGHNLALGFNRINQSVIHVINEGGDTDKLTGFIVMVNGTRVSPISGMLMAQTGSSANYTAKSTERITIYADFSGTLQLMVNDTIRY